MKTRDLLFAVKCYQNAVKRGKFESTEYSDEMVLPIVDAVMDLHFELSRNNHADVAAYEQRKHVNIKCVYEDQIGGTIEDALAVIAISVYELGFIAGETFTIDRRVASHTMLYCGDVSNNRKIMTLLGKLINQVHAPKDRVYAILYLLDDMCEDLGIELDYFIDKRMEYNELLLTSKQAGS